MEQVFNPHLPERVHEVMCEIDARLAIPELDRLLQRAEVVAGRTRGMFYMRDPNRFPRLREALGARSDYVLSL